MDPKELGKKIRRLRAKSGIGLRQLSRLADVSPASIISIEKGDSSPVLATLHKVLVALGTNFAEFFSNEQNGLDSPVFQPQTRRTVQGQNREYTFLLPKRQDIKFTVMHETIASGELESPWESHDYDLAGVILSGGPAELEVEGFGKWKLRKGWSFYVKANSKHRLNNLGKRNLEQITVMNSPGY